MIVSFLTSETHHQPMLSPPLHLLAGLGWDVPLVGSALVQPVLRKFMCVLQLRGDFLILLLDNTAACAW